MIMETADRNCGGLRILSEYELLRIFVLSIWAHSEYAMYFL